ncbi:uncharacterized protein LOC131303459 [Rhododendron vialii]|uniref:uncharacterized protein LOC131303459 n=1 Tax=Rhododendron vialii TaxID=182163 RepID=UPI00265D83B6|nr:uncharacterized protein LOC131303459 [Rhododendron vialii]XP_058186319.1 uncharacterized protein LOC131303459 [Rhododendron vialii]
MDRQRNIERNSAVLSALGLKTMSKALFGSNLTAKKKPIKEGKSKMDCCNDDEEYQLCEDEEGMSSREDVASSRFQANKVILLIWRLLCSLGFIYIHHHFAAVRLCA